MPTLNRKYNWGSRIKDDNPDLYNQLSDSYEDVALAVNTKVSKVSRPLIDPPANDPFNRNFDIGDVYVRPDINRSWMLTSRTTDTAVTWTQLTP